MYSKGETLRGFPMPLPTTVDDFIPWLEDNPGWFELVSGKIFSWQNPSTRHKRLIDWLSREMRRHARTLDGYTVRAHSWHRLNENTYALADAACMSDGTITLMVEVLFPERQAEDSILKRTVYEAAGILEYWQMRPWEERVVALRLDRGSYVEVESDGERLRSEGLPGFALDLTTIWEQG